MAGFEDVQVGGPVMIPGLPSTRRNATRRRVRCLTLRANAIRNLPFAYGLPTYCRDDLTLHILTTGWWQEILTENIFHLPFTRFREGGQWEACVLGRVTSGPSIGQGQALERIVTEAVAAVDTVGDRVAGLPDTSAPARRPMRRLIAPLQEVEQEPLELTGDGVLVVDAQRLDLLRQVVDV